MVWYEYEYLVMVMVMGIVYLFVPGNINVRTLINVVCTVTLRSEEI